SRTSSYPEASSCSSSTVTPTSSISTLSLHDALPILQKNCPLVPDPKGSRTVRSIDQPARGEPRPTAIRRRDRPFLQGRRQVKKRSEEHTSELQSRENLVCRLLLEKKNPPATHTSDSV